MRSPFDQFAKGLLVGALSPSCRVWTQDEIAPEVLAADARVEPVAALAAARRAVGLLGAMADVPCLIEAFHEAPSGDDVETCLYKLLALRAQKRRDAARERVVLALPLLWIVAAGRPDGVIVAWPLRAMGQWPPGCYEGPAPLGLRLVVASELPRTRETLLVRLMGAGATLKAALEDLRALPPDAWERQLAVPLAALVRLTPREESALSPEDQEIAMDFHQLYREWNERRAREVAELEAARAMAAKAQVDQEQARVAAEQARVAAEQARVAAEQARVAAEQALRTMAHMIERKLGRRLSDDEQETLAQRATTLGPDRMGDVILDLDREALAAWLASPDAR